MALIEENGKIIMWHAGAESEKRSENVRVAYEMVKPMLKQTYEAQIKKRLWRSNTGLLTTYVLEQGEWLYFFSDSYPYKAPGVDAPRNYKNGAVRFNQRTKVYRMEQL